MLSLGSMGFGSSLLSSLASSFSKSLELEELITSKSSALMVLLLSDPWLLLLLLLLLLFEEKAVDGQGVLQDDEALAVVGVPTMPN